MSKVPLVLIVDDEARIRSFVRAGLEEQGWDCEEASTAEEGLMLTLSLHPDLILLDLGLPDRDGQALLREIKGASNLPVIVISARGQEGEKVIALDAGADDFLTKPFGTQELIARIKVAWRRGGPPSAESISFDQLTWDRSARRVFLAGKEVHLTPNEYRLFAAMAHRPGKILTHSWLLKEVWGRNSTELLHYVRIAVAGLRKKIEPHPDSVRYLHTEVGVGYRFFE